MLKFFRKYNKIILAIGCSILMVVFLLPAGVSQLVGNPLKRPVVEYEGGVITQEEINRAIQDLRFLERLHPELLSVFLNVQEPEHWILLTREAEMAGLVGGPDDGRNALISLAEAFTDRDLRQLFQQNPAQAAEVREVYTQQLLNFFQERRADAINSGVPSDVVDRVLARVRGVGRLYDAYAKSQTLSRPELIRAAQRQFDEVEVSFAPVAASALVEQSGYEPSEAEILEHFERYKNTPPRSGEHGFGYQRPPAVRLEWMILNPSELRGVVTVDPVDVNTHWRRNRDQYGDDFAEARPEVEEHLRDQAVQRAMGIAQNVVRAELIKATGNLDTENGRRILPPDWASRRPSFDMIAERVAETIRDRMGVEIPPPDVLRDPRWLDRGTVSTLPVIGFSRVNIGPRSVLFSDLVFSVEELDDRPLGVQTGVTYGPTTTDNGTLCFFRVLDARPSTPPDSVDEVRQRIVNNLKRLNAYEDLLNNQSDILQAVIAQGLEDGTLAYDVSIIYPSVVVTHETTTRRVGASQEDVEALCSAVMSHAARLDPATPLDEQPDDLRYLVVPQPSIMNLAVMKIEALRPLPLEDFQAYAQQVSMMRRLELQRSYQWPFSYERMVERHQVRRLTDEENDDDAIPTAPPAEAS